MITAEGGHPIHCRDWCDSVPVCHLLLDEEPQVSPLYTEVQVPHRGVSLLFVDFIMRTHKFKCSSQYKS